MRPAHEAWGLPAWSRAFESATTLTTAYWAGLSRLCDPSDLRRRWVADLTELSAAFLRSPLFLGFMRLQRSALSRAPLTPSSKS
jgi:hypothetical protein